MEPILFLSTQNIRTKFRHLKAKDIRAYHLTYSAFLRYFKAKNVTLRHGWAHDPLAPAVWDMKSLGMVVNSPSLAA